MTLTKEKTNYIDVTDEWLGNATSFSSEVLDRNYFEHNGIKYFVDGKNVVLDYSKKEKEIAIWLSKTFSGTVYMLPRINKPDGIQTPDYIFKDNYWDLKTINGSSKQALYHTIRKKQRQSNNFIFEITNSKFSMKNIQIQVKNLYKRTDVPFINELIIKKGNKFKVFKRK